MKLILCALTMALVHIQVNAAPVMTRFDPKLHGFKFINDFVDDQNDTFDQRSAGFCAGMSYNACDYFKSGKPVPQQWWTPARGTPLERQILDRHKSANFDNLDRLLELEFNPGGERDSEFYEWGVSSRIPELRASIDRGNPIPIYLRGDGNGHHMVLAIGYDMGQYLGNKKGRVSDFTIFVYDPNYPGEITQIKPDPARKVFVYNAPANAKNSRIKYRTWACDTKYAYKAPLDVPLSNFPSDGKTSGLLFHFDTGDDDLRGGKDGGSSYINLKVVTTTGEVMNYPRASLGHRWLSDTTQSVFFSFRQPLNIRSIQSVSVNQVTEGGFSPDNWTVKSVEVQEIGKSAAGIPFSQTILRHGQHRFDGNARTLTLNSQAPVPNNMTKTIVCTFRTDGDDLRGGNDNVAVNVNFVDGTRQRFENVNQGVQWKNNSTNVVRLELSTAKSPVDISSVTLDVSKQGSSFADNWTMGYFTAQYVKQGLMLPLATWGQFRFTKDKTTLNVLAQPRYEVAKSRQLQLQFQTGGDDLRGGNDNLKIKVNLKSGRSEVFTYVNEGVQWNNNTQADITLMLSQPTLKSEILSIELEIDRGGDNWSMSNARAWLRVRGNPIPVFEYGAFRFTGSSSKLVITP